MMFTAGLTPKYYIEAHFSFLPLFSKIDLVDFYFIKTIKSHNYRRSFTIVSVSGYCSKHTSSFDVSNHI